MCSTSSVPEVSLKPRHYAAGKPATIALPESLGTGWKPVFGEVAAGMPDAAFPKVGIPTESGRVWVRAIK